MNAEGHARREPDAFRPAPRLLATLCFSGKNDFLSLARSTTTHVAGLLDLPLSRANDLRLAVDEACALFLTAAPAAAAALDGPASLDGVAAGEAPAPPPVLAAPASSAAPVSSAGAAGSAPSAGSAASATSAEAQAPASAGGLALVFAEVGGELRITVSGPTPLRQPDVDSLGWILMCALVGEPRWEVEEDVGILTLCEPIPILRA